MSEQEQQQEQQQSNPQASNQDYKVKFPFDFGRGFPELCFYWPARKELRVEVKNANGDGEAIKMNPEIMGRNPTADMVYIWDATRFHRKWHDDDFAGVELDPKLAPPGIYDKDIPVPPGATASIKDQPTREIQSPQTQQDTPDPDVDIPERETAIQGNGQPAAAAGKDMRIGNQPAIMLDLATYNDYQTLIEVDGMVNQTLMAIIEQTVEPDSIEMSIVKIQREKSEEIRGRLYGESSGSDTD